MAGITPYGFQRKTLREILASMKQNLRTKLGEDWNLETGSPEDQFISVFAAEADEVWQGLEGIYSSQTLDGAESIYLDDVLTQQGVYRKGKTPSSGRAILFSNYATTTMGATVPDSTTVSANNSLTYQFQNTVTIDNYMSAYKLSASQLTAGTEYEFSIYTANAPSVETFTWRVVTESDKDRMLRALEVYITDNILNSSSVVYYDGSEGVRTLFVGFNPATGLPQPFNRGELYVSATPKAGSLGYTVDLAASVVGFNPLEANGLLSISPSFVGYESIVNGDDFNAGSEVQTDAEYRLTAINVRNTSIAGTVDSLITGLLNLDGVEDAEVYENPTPDYIYDVSNNTVTNPYTYNVAVLGGNDSEVAQVILDKSPANTKRYGLYSAPALNSKNQTVSVNFTRVGYFDVEVEVNYKAKDNTLLTETEKTSIINNIAQATSALKIGDSVPKSLLEAVTFQSVAFSRLSQVSVRLKDLTDVGGQFVADNITADYDEKPRVLIDKVIFKRM